METVPATAIVLAMLIVSIPYATGAETTALHTQYTTHQSSQTERCDGSGDAAVARETSNKLLWVQNVFGWLSILACLAVLSVGYAHGKDRHSLRARIIVGLFLANIAFSIGVSVPVNAYACQSDGTWKLLITSARTHAYTTAFLHAGKYPTAMYEVFIVLASVMSLRSGSVNIPRRAEIVGHTVCFVTFAITYGVFVSEALPVLTYTYSHPWNRTTVEVYKGYHTLERSYVDGWIAVFVIFVLAWLYQRSYLHRLIRQWDVAKIDAEQDWNRDLWNTSNVAVREERERKARLLGMQKQSYLELAKPLEPYVFVSLCKASKPPPPPFLSSRRDDRYRSMCPARYLLVHLHMTSSRGYGTFRSFGVSPVAFATAKVFVAFSVPGIVLATQWCGDQSDRVWLRKAGSAADCIDVCYLVLALRPLATAAVYFSDAQCILDLGLISTISHASLGAKCAKSRASHAA